MGNLNGEPRGGSMVWLMTVLVIVLAAKADTAVADIAILALTMYAMRTDHTSRM